VHGLLVRSAQFVKCARGASFLPRLFAHSLYEADPKLGACLELATWRGGATHLEEALFAEANCVTATGSDETLIAIRQRLPARVRFLGHGHRLSFAFVSAPVLTSFNLARIVSRAAADVTAWNQLGCLSPHIIYVESGGETNGERFAGLLAAELEQRERVEPRGPVPPEVAAGIAARRGIYEVRAAHSPGTQQWSSAESTAWTVVFEADPRFQMSCLNRFIYVKPVVNLVEALQAADGVRHQVSTVGVAVPEHALGEVAGTLARWGATRVCPLGKMQEPPLSWRHDGRLALADLVTWVDLELQ
jgi:Acyl-CoA reductase (LuxC)